jgi:hypothetical protein
MPDPFAGRSDISSQGESWKLLVTSDTVDFAVIPKALWVDVAGTLKIRGADGNDETFTVAAGLVPLRPTRVWAAGTTATGIKAIF